MSAQAPTPPEKPGWRQTLLVYREPASLRMLFLGFSAGLPLLLVFGTLSFWLREADIDRATIGYLSWVGLAYGFKWVWSPLVDRLPIPLLTRFLGRRRSWLLLAQIVIALALLNMAGNDPRLDMTPVVWGALAVAFASATQDIALDAFRIESGDSRHQAALSATYQAGYRIAMIWAGAGALWIAARAESNASNLSHFYDPNAWRIAYSVMAASMLPGMIVVLLSPEPQRRATAVSRNVLQWLTSAIIEPFVEFLRRMGWQAAPILLLISVYRLSDVVMGIMANPFYVDLGFTKDEVAMVTKIYGVLMTLAGAFLGGSLALRFGVMRVLILGAALSIPANLLFAWMATQGHSLGALVFVISADNLASGIASAAFIAFLSSLTSLQFSATQYALLSSLMLLLPKFVAGYSGVFVNHYGYQNFFTTTACIGVAVLILVVSIARMKFPVYDSLRSIQN